MALKDKHSKQWKCKCERCLQIKKKQFYKKLDVPVNLNQALDDVNYSYWRELGEFYMDQDRLDELEHIFDGDYDEWLNEQQQANTKTQT